MQPLTQQHYSPTIRSMLFKMLEWQRQLQPKQNPIPNLLMQIHFEQAFWILKSALKCFASKMSTTILFCHKRSDFVFGNFHLCNSFWQSSQYIEEEKATMRVKQLDIFPCDPCSSVLKHSADLWTHKTSIRGGKLLRCDKCSFTANMKRLFICWRERCQNVKRQHIWKFTCEVIPVNNHKLTLLNIEMWFCFNSSKLSKDERAHSDISTVNRDLFMTSTEIFDLLDRGCQIE